MKHLILAAALTAALLTPAMADTIKTYGTDTRIGVVQGLELTDIQRKGLREFRHAKAYFGALYVSLDGQAYLHFYNWHDLAKVKTAAKAGCETISEGSPCTLAAVSVPAEVSVSAASASGLGKSARRDLDRYRARQVAGKSGAFAISGSAHQGYAYGWPNIAEARATALAYCEAEVARDFAAIGIEGRRFARANGYDTCRVIDVTQP